VVLYEAVARNFPVQSENTWAGPQYWLLESQTEFEPVTSLSPSTMQVVQM